MSHSSTPALTEPTEGAVTDAPTELDPALKRRNTVVIWLLIVAAFTVILNETIMGIAIPHLMEDLHITAVAAQWLTAGFLLTMAVVIPLTGFILERFTTRAVFLAAAGLFTAGTLLGALAPGFEVLLAARVVQATGTAIMFPLLMTTVMQLEPPATRGRRMGNIAIVISVAPAIGPTISGLILQVLPWRFLYLFVLPVAITVLVLGWRKMVNITEPKHSAPDWLSVPLALLGFGGLVLGLSLLGEGTHGSPATMLLPLGVGVVAMCLFVWRQLARGKTGNPLLDLRTFTSPTFTLAVVMFIVAMMGMFGVFILLPMFMQNVMHLSVLHSGLLMLPGGLLSGLLAPGVGRLYDKVGPRPLVIPGTIALTGAVALLAFLAREGVGWPAILGGNLLFSTGLALLFTPLFSASMGALPKHLYSHGSATLSALQQVAAAAGTAMFVAIMSAVAAQQVLAGASDAAAQAHGIRTAFTLAACIAACTVVIAPFIRRPPATDED